MKKTTQANLMLLAAAMIWGSAFVAQSAGMEYVGPFTFNMTRSIVGSLVLIPVVLFFRRLRYARTPYTVAQKAELNRNSVVGGICCGIILCIASNFQQVGISMTTAGKAGFITALYIIFVPIIGIPLGRRTPKIIWLCVLIALFGFYLLCIKEGFSISNGDLLCLVCAFAFAFYILVIDHFTTGNTDPILISSVQFMVSGLLSMVIAFLTETPTWEAIKGAGITILYAGVLSSGVAYTFQVVAQRNADPTIATLIMSLESVFAALFGWMILHEALSLKELLGCLLVFAAVILAQIPLPDFGKRKGES